MAIEVKDVATTQSVQGQPINDGNTTDNGGAAVTDNPSEAAISAEGNVTASDAGNDKPATAQAQAQIKLSPEALKQITALSTTNRALKKQIDELNAKVNGLATPADTQAKLERLAKLETILTSPRAWLKESGKTLEDIAADVLAAGDEVTDPRVDALLEKVAAVDKRLQDEDAKRQTDTQTQAQAEEARMTAQATEHVKTFVGANPVRWELIASKPEIAGEIVKAAIAVVERDYKGKTLTREQSQAILEECADSAETLELAKRLQEDKKKIVDTGESLVKRKGLEVQDSESYQPSKGSDGKQANGARTPKVVIDANRGAVRRGAVERGPTDVRTARARMLRIARGESE